MTSHRFSLVVLVSGLLLVFGIPSTGWSQPSSLEEALVAVPWLWTRDGGKGEAATVTCTASGAVHHQADKNSWDGRWKKTGPLTAVITHDKVTWTLTFVPGFRAFQGVTASGKGHVSGQPKPPAPVVAPKPPPSPAANSALAITPRVTKFGGMSLASDWMPKYTETKKELISSLDFYASASADRGKPDKNKVPGTLFGGIRWLMPLEEAMKTLPREASRTSENRITSICFPQNSLSMIGFQLHFFEDRGERFNLLYMIVDAERRVVGVELVSQAPKEVIWRPKWDGVRNPYYDFVSLKANGRTGQEVRYEIRPAGPGLTLIKTALWDFKKLAYLENVHWYLAAPFARSLLEITAFNQR